MSLGKLTLIIGVMEISRMRFFSAKKAKLVVETFHNEFFYVQKNVHTKKYWAGVFPHSKFDMIIYEHILLCM